MLNPSPIFHGLFPSLSLCPLFSRLFLPRGRGNSLSAPTTSPQGRLSPRSAPPILKRGVTAIIASRRTCNTRTMAARSRGILLLHKRQIPVDAEVGYEGKEVRSPLKDWLDKMATTR
jgi:hypothetical protein